MKPAKWKYLESVTAESLRMTLDEWRSTDPGVGLLGLVCEQEPEAVTLLQQAANAVALPLAGAVVPGLVVGGGFSRKGMLLLALDAKIPQIVVPMPSDGSGTADAAIAELAAFVDARAGEDGADTLLLFFDATTPDIGSLLDRLYLLIGDRVRYVGSNVGSETFKPVPCIFDNLSLIKNAALALVLPAHPGASLAHHYCGEVSQYITTSATGNRINHIDGRPAFLVYRELVAKTYDIELTRENFYQYAVRFPLALQMATGEPLVRMPVAVLEDDSLYCAGEVPESVLVSVVEAVPPGSEKTAQWLATQMRQYAPASVLVFYCAGRLMYQGAEAATAELGALREHLDPAAVFGLLSLGEVGNVHGDGHPRFHNAAIVGLPWC